MASLELLHVEVPEQFERLKWSLLATYAFDFYFYTDQQSGAQQFAQRLDDCAFQATVERSPINPTRWLALVKTNMDVSHETLVGVSRNFIKAMAGIDVEYDGWEAGSIWG